MRWIYMAPARFDRRPPEQGDVMRDIFLDVDIQFE